MKKVEDLIKIVVGGLMSAFAFIMGTYILISVMGDFSKDLSSFAGFLSGVLFFIIVLVLVVWFFKVLEKYFK